MTDRKAIVFLRQYNDIDHIVPVLYKWCTMGGTSIHAVITTLPDYLDDYRINLLRQFQNCKIHFIEDFLSEGEREEKGKRRVGSQPSRISQFWPARIGHRVLNKIFNPKAQVRSHPLSYPDPYFATPGFVERIFDSVFEREDKGIVVFDWIISVEFVKLVLQAAENRGYATVSLPHGDSPYYNLLENINDLNYGRMDNYRRNETIFDYLVVPNKLCARRYDRWMGPDRLKVLGSPRYNDEWLGVISNLIPEYKTETGIDKLKIAFFLRPMDYAIHWDEVIRTIKLVLQFPEVCLVVKHHTRKQSVSRLIQTYPELGASENSNLEFAFNDVHSGSLIKWADVILDLGTSATFEAVRRGKPVLAMEYMQANYLTISYYMSCCEMKCRDDLYDTIEAFTKNGTREFYAEEERHRFIKEVIGDPASDILEGYVRFLEGCLDATKPRKSFEGE